MQNELHHGASRFVSVVQMKRLELGDYLVIAEAITRIPADALWRIPGLVGRVESALAAPFAGFGTVEIYRTLPLKAAVLCSRLNRNHPLPDGNKRAAYLSMLEFIDRNGWRWRPVAPTAERAEAVERLAGGVMTEREFASWIERQVERGAANG